MDLTDDLRLSTDGDDDAARRLMPAVYDELRRLAARYLRRESAGHTLQTTALVHEAYLRLVDQTRARYHDRSHFIAVAATAMRRILVDYARSRASAKRAMAAHGPRSADGTIDASADFLEIDEALDRLASRSARQAKVVELRYFAGLDVAGTAAVIGVSETTVKSDWALACDWLKREWDRAEHER